MLSIRENETMCLFTLSFYSLAEQVLYCEIRLFVVLVCHNGRMFALVWVLQYTWCKQYKHIN
jgi:hypothetical protein